MADFVLNMISCQGGIPCVTRTRLTRIRHRMQLSGVRNHGFGSPLDNSRRGFTRLEYKILSLATDKPDLVLRTIRNFEKPEPESRFGAIFATMAKIAAGLLLQAILLQVVPHAAAFPAKLVSRADAEYDYVVIGGGPSGLVVAERLSENKDVSVLVIESGPLLEGKEESDELLVNPKFTNLGFGGAKFTWPNISSGPQEGLNGRYFLQVYGKVRDICELVILSVRI